MTPEDSAYLPSPPITPLCRRTLKRQQEDIKTDGNSSLSLFTLASSAGSPKRRKTKTLSDKIRKNKSRHLNKGNGYVLTSENKSSVGRVLSTTKNPRIVKPATIKRPRCKGVPRLSLDIDEIFTSYSSPSPTPFCLPQVPKPNATTKKTPSNTKPRTTNNSVSSKLTTTLNSTITKRKWARTKPLGVGKVCASYYPSSRKIVPHAPGDRYPKGKP